MLLVCMGNSGGNGLVTNINTTGQCSQVPLGYDVLDPQWWQTIQPSDFLQQPLVVHTWEIQGCTWVGTGRGKNERKEVMRLLEHRDSYNDFEVWVGLWSEEASLG